MNQFCEKLSNVKDDECLSCDVSIVVLLCKQLVLSLFLCLIVLLFDLYPFG